MILTYQTHIKITEVISSVVSASIQRGYNLQICILDTKASKALAPTEPTLPFPDCCPSSATLFNVCSPLGRKLQLAGLQGQLLIAR